MRCAVSGYRSFIRSGPNTAFSKSAHRLPTQGTARRTGAMGLMTHPAFGAGVSRFTAPRNSKQGNTASGPCEEATTNSWTSLHAKAVERPNIVELTLEGLAAQSADVL
jgi:hypothetical protein